MSDGGDQEARATRSQANTPPEAIYREDRWVYESIVGSIPGMEFSRTQAMAIQLGLFGIGVIVIAALTDRWTAAPAGLAAVAVVSAGSVLMLTLGRRIRNLDVPGWYTHTLFGTGIEIVLGVFSYVGLITYLFVAEPRQPGPSLLETLLGPEPSVLAVAFTLLVLWDVCYRIGTGWWASIVGLWRSVLFADRLDRPTRAALMEADLVTIGFAAVQLVLLPFLDGHRLLALLVAGHVVAVTLVSGLSVLLLRQSR
ncbi:putative membrane protein [Halapricum desulfuricans]|uniref:Putative membrane protein n=1 Tax=Halapricum desulfuricans TaxID=2841257 RepID=A0A897NKK8_9EURY|nr:hypothetical protein [Halapricum desulfuricans]QSG13297.1 putative membrane protein [Halapricum desulfuricans]